MGIVLGVVVAGVLILFFFLAMVAAQPIADVFHKVGEWLGDHQIAIFIAVILAIGGFVGWVNQRPNANPDVSATAAPITSASPSGTRVSKPPLHTRLICTGQSGGSNCGHTLHFIGDVLTLRVQGLTQDVVHQLCAEGYKSRWSENVGGDLTTSPMCANVPAWEGPDYSTGTLTESFRPPTDAGLWVIAWRLYDRAGRLVRSSHYKVRLVP
jgi:hypothetical protein